MFLMKSREEKKRNELLNVEKWQYKGIRFKIVFPFFPVSLLVVVPDFSSDTEAYSKWNNFVDSIKSKLTVKQVVDGVRTGGCVSFDYLLLIVTAE